MSAEIVIALIALATSVLSALLAALLGLRSQVRLQQLMRAMDEQQRQREVVDRYREPLVRAAHGLQSRLWNIGQEGFAALLRSLRPRASSTGAVAGSEHQQLCGGQHAVADPWARPSRRDG